MRLNANTTLQGAKCVLVPYREEHVNTYHCWMQDPELQQLTASEPLTLDQEFEMQRAWRDDADKLTFIVLDRRVQPDTPGTGSHGGAMAGDVNLFFIQDDEDEDEEGEGQEGEGEEERQRQRRGRIAEIEVMIAEPGSRRGGLATEALRLLMAYATRRLGVGKFVAKIGAANAPSLALFGGGGEEKGGEEEGGDDDERRSRGLGFVEVRRVAAFDEVHLALDVRPGTAARAGLDAVLLLEGRYDDDEEEGGEGEGATALSAAALARAAEEVLNLAPAGGPAGSLPAAGAAVLLRPPGGGEEEEEDGGGAKLVQRLAAVGGVSAGGAAAMLAD
jgi:RimJ/RimL family protein N-acetyltransferase